MLASNAAEMEAPLQRSASKTTRSRAHPEFISRDAFSSPHAHHLDEETACIAALVYEAGFVIKSLGVVQRGSGVWIATRMRTLSNKRMWQTASFTVHDFPREALLSLPEVLKTQDWTPRSCSSTMPTRWRKWRSSRCRSRGAQNHMADSLLPGISPGGAGDANGWR